MKKNVIPWQRLHLRHFLWFLVAVLAALVSLEMIFRWRVMDQSEAVISERLVAQEMTLVRSGALAIADFFDYKEPELLLLAVNPAVQAGEEREGRRVMELWAKNLYEQRGILVDAVRVDKDGIGLWTVNAEENREGEGVSLADRNYFLWAKEQKDLEVFVSEPLFARGGVLKGEWAVVMAAPVFYQGSFNGVVILGLPIGKLTEKYVTPLLFSDQAQVNLFDENGAIVTSSEAGMTGINIFEYVQDKEWPGKEEFLATVKDALAGNAGGAVYNLYSQTLAGESMRKAVAYAPVEIDGQTWSLMVTVPYQGVSGIMSPFEKNWALWAVFSLICLPALILMIVFGVRVAQRDGFHDGFLDGRDGHGKRKS